MTSIKRLLGEGLRIALIAAIVGGIMPAASTVYRWSQTAATNATVDPTINWREGQSPSLVNDSARAMMAALAKYRDDIAGGIVATGNSTAYALSTNQGLTSLTAGFHVCFQPPATNTGAVTLNVDSLGAKPLRVVVGSDAPAGSFRANQISCATYRTSNSGEWVSVTGPSQVPTGVIAPFVGADAPDGWLLADGSAVSRTTYAALFAVICPSGSNCPYGDGDGSTTFNLPNLTGRVPAGVDSAGSVLASFSTLGRTTGSGSITLTTNNLPSHSHGISLTTSQDGSHTHSITDPGHTHGFQRQTGVQGVSTSPVADFAADPDLGVFTTNSAVTGISINPAGAHTHTVSGSTSSVGSGQAFNNAQPSLAVNYIIKH